MKLLTQQPRLNRRWLNLRTQRRVVATAAAVPVLVMLISPAAPAASVQLITARNLSVSLAAENANCIGAMSVSADGRWLALVSDADDLVPRDTNRLRDVFVRDMVSGTHLLVSVGRDGGPARGGNSMSAVISGNGRYVAFVSSATNLTADVFPTNHNNVFRRDLQTGTTVLVSAGADALSSGDRDSADPVISPDGRYVAFLSRAKNLAPGSPGDISGGVNTFWRDVERGQTVGMKGAGVFKPSLGGNGRYVAYSAPAGLCVRDTHLGTDIFTRAGTVTAAAIDPSGTKILYQTANALCVDNINPRANLFTIATTARVRNAGCWSDDGRWLTFISSSNLMGGDDGLNKVYLMDFQTGALSLIGLAGPGHEGEAGASDGPAISGDGRFVAYRSLVTNTVAGDTTAPPNMFLFDRVTGSHTLLTARTAVPGPRFWVSRPFISGDGSTVAFLCGSGLVSSHPSYAPAPMVTPVNANALLTDSDRDGVSDRWLMQHFGHPTGRANDDSRASDDPDGDGASNEEEFLLGTDPTSPQPVFEVPVAAATRPAITLIRPAVSDKSRQF